MKISYFFFFFVNKDDFYLEEIKRRPENCQSASTRAQVGMKLMD